MRANLAEDENAPNWKEILIKIYEGEALGKVNIGPKSVGIKSAEEGKPVEGPDLTEEEEKSLSFLENHGLIDRNDPFTELTKKGFNVTLDVERQNAETRRENRNRAIQGMLVIITMVLALTSVMGLLFRANVVSQFLIEIGAISILLITLLGATKIFLTQG